MVQHWEQGGETVAVKEITRDTSVAEIVKLCLALGEFLDEHGLKGCGGGGHRIVAHHEPGRERRSRIDAGAIPGASPLGGPVGRL